MCSLALVLLLPAPLTAEAVATKPQAEAIASAHPLATRAGLAIMAQGGNAFDAAIAVASTLAVVAPYHSGLGGGGFWLLYDAKTQKNQFLDSREVAPLKAHRDMFLDAKGEPIKGLSLDGALAAAIPGEPAALAYLAQHYGHLPLAQSLAPAIRLAEKGFMVDQQFYDFVMMEGRLAQLRRFPATAKVFLKNDEPYQPGECLRQPELARTLRGLAEKGHDGFYRGEVAQKLVAAVQAAGGIWTIDDLATYQVKMREPLEGAFRNLLIVTAPPPSAGGVALLTMFNIIHHYPMDALPSVLQIHYLVEAMRLAFWQRDQYLADPDFVKIPLAHLLSMENAQALLRYIKPDKATASSELGAVQAEAAKVGNTTHFSIIDREGNRVAATLTVNYIFGSSLVAEGTGVLLNDEMDDFSIKPGVKNVFGLVGSTINTIAPGKRPLSSMTPTFLIQGQRLAIVGTPGGSRIPTMLLLAALRFHEGKGAISMVSRMRFHHQYLPDWLQFEPDSFSAEEQQKLKAMGYSLMELKQYYGDMQAITWDQRRNFLTATADPRHIGLGVVVDMHKGGYGLHH
ncbi:MAG: gamma-glutamyltransferase [Legionellaceae bacterium]|nr:gamma-glutamyltransferase [Legionellaceae bacterium]